MPELLKVSSSFRDPGGQVFTAEGAIYRLIRRSAVPHYRHLMDSGLYDRLVSGGLLVPHEDATADPAVAGVAGEGEIVIRPQRVPFISYPPERGFAALKAGALNTLAVQQACLAHGMTLQDASAFNVQFLGGRWVFIDTGSFRMLDKPGPWSAYGQFCRHFLAPLTLMAGRDARLSSLLLKYPDGIPLDLAARLLPWRMKARPPVWLHIVMHGRLAARDNRSAAPGTLRMGMNALQGLIDHLQSFIQGLDLEKEETAWTSYEDTHTYDAEEYAAKEVFVKETVARIRPGQVWDLGANTGHFSRLVADAAPVTAFESDFMTNEAGYRKSLADCGKSSPLHLWTDLFNPVSGFGWAGEEWPGLAARGPADLVLALALIHHLCIGGNLPFDKVSGFLRRVARHLVIEFVPPSDPQTRRLIGVREETFPWYEQAAFEKAFSADFDVLERKIISATGRTLYFLRRAEGGLLGNGK